MSLNLRGKRVVVFGGSGFIGSHLVNHLCEEACEIKIITRKKKSKNKLFFANEPGQVSFEEIDYNQTAINKALSNYDIVFNLIGILAENKKSKFQFVHTEIPRMIAKGAKINKIKSFIHLSALNINVIKDSKYALSKYKGEIELKKEFPNSVIVRPSVVFGKGDNFTIFFSNLSKFSPFLPLIGTPSIQFSKNIFKTLNFDKKVRFQPVYVGDLSKFLIKMISKKNKTFDIAGPSIKSFSQIFDLILEQKERIRIYLPLPFFIARIMAFFLELLPGPLLTRDQIKLLKYDSVSKKGLSNLKTVISNPLSIETVLKTYL
jgi:NADH dehydrogenase